MASIEQFTIRGGWQVQEWNPSESGLPPSAFEKGSTTVLIGIANHRQKICNVAWLSEHGQWCFIAGLQYDPEDGTLKGSDIQVTCGGTRFSHCDVNLSISPPMKITKKREGKAPKTNREGFLTGWITRDPFVDGNTGTFTADARPVGDDGNGAG